MTDPADWLCLAEQGCSSITGDCVRPDPRVYKLSRKPLPSRLPD